MRNVSILGTGWLGFPLSKTLQDHGYHIKGSTTSSHKLRELADQGVTPYQIALHEDGPSGNVMSFLEGSSVLIINIPPGLRRNPNLDFVSKIKNLIPYIEDSDIKNVLFVSSTSVFSDIEGFPSIYEETTPNATSNAGKQLIEAEKLLQKSAKFATTILRFAGLFGPNRHPANMLSKRSGIKNPKAPVNLIHLEDCIGIIKRILETENWNQVFNASFPYHPEKAAYYSEVCKQMGLPQPDYDFSTPSKGKIIESQTLISVLSYQFKKNL